MDFRKFLEEVDAQYGTEGGRLYYCATPPSAFADRWARRFADPVLAFASAMVEQVRGLGLYKPPGVAETIDWAQGASVLAAEGAPWRAVFSSGVEIM